MISFDTEKNSILYKIFDTLKNLDCDSMLFKITLDGVYIQSTDMAKICILDIKINKKYFENYKVDSVCSIDLDIEFINKVCKIFNKKNKTNFEVKENYLYIRSIRESEEDIEKQYRININYNNSYDIIDIHKLILENNYEMKSSDLLNICNDLNIFSDDMTITLNNKNICFSITNDLGDTQYYLDTIKNDYKIIAAFKLKFIIKCKLIQLFEKINFKIDNDKPIVLILQEENININYILAPNYICE